MTRPKPGWTPPMRDGVSPSRVGVGTTRHATLLDFLVARFPQVHDWPQRLSRGEVLGDDGAPAAAESPCTLGMAFWYWREPPPEPRVPFDIDILFQDEALVVIDKPHFLPTMPGGRHLVETALVRLKQQLGIATLVPMHRLDRETAGVLVFVVQPANRHAYHCTLRDRTVHKVYEAVAPWRADLALPLTCRHRIEEPPGRNFMQMQVVPGEPNAETLVELLCRLGPEGALGHYRLTPHTGRKHQLRTQMNALGLPIAGDRIYPRLLPEPPPGAEPDYSHPLQLLAREFAFVDPITGRERRFVSRRSLQLAG
ncbi:pseudouridine synthase [Xylophilus sp. GOD-11R]|uniref:pseudouridine synthase n=1 Tax=Xylophilus sp. GOD-11R TaxID=3089814 RepID=UPI00298D5669|nr:pseudouridine synthase [Xylophilus sp. GOD-11R]WPB55761.1 pseudouridine synthase [Xylophilus sp. GOD-11R]